MLNYEWKGNCGQITVVGAHGTWGNEYIDDYLGLVLPITAEII